jgi:hypothetical protein
MRASHGGLEKRLPRQEREGVSYVAADVPLPLSLPGKSLGHRTE